MAKLLKQAKLVLEDGSEFSGWAFGKARSQAGEVVFSTAMTGLNQSLTDPAYRGQILVSTFPLAGNCGAALDKNGKPFLDANGLPVHYESNKIHVSALVVSEICDEPSHYSCSATLSSWLEKNNIPGIYGIDTRALAIRLRDQGTMMGKILIEGSKDVTFDSGIIENPVADVSPAEPSTIQAPHTSKEKQLNIVMIDCGAKVKFINAFLNRGVSITRVPWNHDLNGLEFDAMVISGGPGDPRSNGKTIAMIRRAFTMEKPMFGTGLGCQFMALAAGADCYKLPFGHRGLNHPCIEIENGKQGRCYITSQNHGYAIRKETLPISWEPWFINNNDGTIEGIRSARGPFYAVQFHPEGSPGPNDTEFLIDNFITEVHNAKNK